MVKFILEKILNTDTKILVEADTIEELNRIVAETNWESLPVLPSVSKSPTLPRGVYEGVQQLLSKVKPKTYLDKVLIFAYWLENSEVIKSFNVTDIETLFRQCLEKPSANLNHILNYLSGKKGWLIEVEQKEGKKAWRISRSGIEHIESLLRGDLSGK